MKEKNIDDFLDPHEIFDRLIDDDFIYQDECPDPMIKKYLPTTKHTDLINTSHEGCFSSNEVHAKRIAEMINKISDGIQLTPIVIYINQYDGSYYIHDGRHRLRAHMYLNIKVPVIKVYTNE